LFQLLKNFPANLSNMSQLTAARPLLGSPVLTNSW